MKIIIYILSFIIIMCSKPKMETVKIDKLIWQKCSLGLSGTDCTQGTAVQLPWDDAVKACENLNEDGKKWRLPTLEELSSLISCKDGKKISKDISCEWKEDELSPDAQRESVFNSSLFPGTQKDFYWSSFTGEYESLDGTKKIVAYNIDFDFGMVSFVEKKYKKFIRCVTE